MLSLCPQTEVLGKGAGMTEVKQVMTASFSIHQAHTVSLMKRVFPPFIPLYLQILHDIGYDHLPRLRVPLQSRQGNHTLLGRDLESTTLPLDGTKVLLGRSLAVTFFKL